VYFSYIVTINFIGGGNRSARRKPPTCCKAQTNFITGFVTRLTRRVPLVEQELHTLPEHMSSPLVLVGFVLLDLSFYVYVLSFCPFFPHYVVCSSSNYGLWLPLWYLQTTLITHIMLYRVHLAWAGFELAMLVVISTVCIGSCNQTTIQLIDLIDFFCVLTPLSAIFQLYHGDQF
jgi:hypothetical protein